MTLTLTDERLRSLEEPEAMQCIVRSLPEGKLYDLTFHASFAIKLFEVMRRSGPGSQGFDRMQQSFRDSVEQVHALLSLVATDCTGVQRFIALESNAQAALVRLMRDLARYKGWTLEEPSNK